jgi:flagellar L-ring protein precursor FlgH
LLFALLTLCAFLSACANLAPNRPNPDAAAIAAQYPAGAPQALPATGIPQPAAAPVVNDGSLFQPQMAAQWSPWRDDTAHAVGDIITVRISVNTTAEKSASTDLNRESNLKAGVTALFGTETDFPGVGADDPNNHTSAEQLVKADSTNAFTGEGDTRRAGKVVADVSAVVTQVCRRYHLITVFIA